MTKQKPYLVIVDKVNNVTLLQLSIPIETNIDSTQNIKDNRNKQLVSGSEGNMFSVDYYSTEIGSRGLIFKGNESRLITFFRTKHPKKDIVP